MNTKTLSLNTKPEFKERHVASSAEQQRLDNILAKMDLPINRRQSRRPQDIRWLIENLGARNAAHPEFNTARDLLLDLAEQQSVMKASEIRRLRGSHAPADDGNFMEGYSAADLRANGLRG